MMIHAQTYAEALKKPSPGNPIALKNFNTAQTNILFRQMKGYDGQPSTVVRQFACEPCYKMWWTRVRSFKQVSKCRRCQIKYDPIPTDLEFGCGYFDCPNCPNVFTGKTQMGHYSTCYECGTKCYPLYILNKLNDERIIMTKRKHWCEICQGCGNCAAYNQILAFSDEHESTGSTLASLSPQNDLDERFIDNFEENDLTSLREQSENEE